jgi:signal transduction histidine kinase
MEDVKKRYFTDSDEIFENVFYKKHINTALLHNPIGMISPKSMLIIVVGNDDRIDGMLILSSLSNPDAFKTRHLRMIKSLKEHINSAFLKASVLEDLQDAMTDLKETQAELVRREKLASIGMLTKGIVDRIINPLNYINNFSQISNDMNTEILDSVKKSDIDPEIKTEIEDTSNMIRHNLEKIHFHGNNTARIVKAMEKLLKEKSNVFIETNINQLIKANAEAALIEYKKKHPERKLPEIKYHFGEDILIPVLPDETGDALRLIIDNACSAVKNSENPELNVNLDSDSEFVIIRIRDNGHGIPEKELEKIFDPFFTTKPTAEGSGLGLYMCKEIIEFAGGKISVLSKVDQFTEIIIHIPIKKI